MAINFYSTDSYLQLDEKFSEALITINLTNEIKLYGLLDNNGFLNLGLNAPFWLPDFLYSRKNLEDIVEITGLIKSNIRNKGISGIRIKIAPAIYSPSIELFEYTLISSGFEVINTAIWQYLDVKSNQTSERYVKNLKHSSRKVLSKFDNLSCSIKVLSKFDNLGIIDSYNLIAENRKKIGTQLKYSSGYLLELINKYPDSVHVLNLVIDGENVAAAICHKTAPTFFYVAAWGDARHGLKYSPMYIFAKLLVDYCIVGGVDILDFGVSSDKNLYTPNLFSFKKNIGCSLCLQKTYAIE